MEMKRQELAELVGITYRQLYNINKKLAEEDKEKALFVESGEGKKCDLALFVRRWAAYCAEKATVDESDLDAVKAAHEKVKIRKTELEVEKMEGLLVDVQDVRRMWGDIANTIMQNLLHLPAILAPELRGLESEEKIAGIIDGEVRKALDGLSETPLPAYLMLASDDEEEEDA